MPTKKTCEIWLIVDGGGNYEVGADLSAAEDLFYDNVGGSGPRRVVKISVKITPPQIEEADVDVADTAGETVETTAE
jgi:hypothetical protein